MLRSIGLAAAAAFTIAGTAQAQDSYHWPSPPASNASNGQQYYLPMGTPLMLRTRTHISTKDNEPGDRIYLEVAESVSFRGQTVIPIGAPVIAEVSRARDTGYFGREGILEIRLRYAETPNGPVRLTGGAGDEGRDQGVLSIGAIALVSPLGFLIRGTSGELPSGTMVEGHLAEPLHFRWYPQTATATNTAQPARADVMAEAQPGFSFSE